MSKHATVAAIFREFIARYPWQFGLLFLLLVAEGALAALSILALVPLADFLLDPALASPSRITKFVVQLCAQAGQTPGFWLFELAMGDQRLRLGQLDQPQRGLRYDHGGQPSLRCAGQAHRELPRQRHCG